jgi:hypothetical protein
MTAPKVKHTYPIFKAELVPATNYWPHRDECQGKFVLLGTNKFGEGVRTSLVVAGSIAEGWVETCNSVYIPTEGEPREPSVGA